MSSTFNSIATELGKSLLPLKTLTSDPDSFQTLLTKLGWSSDDIPPPIADLLTAAENLEVKLEAFVDGTNTDIADFWTALKALFAAIEDLKTKSFDPVLTAQNFTEAFPRQLLDFLVIEYLDNYRPRLGFALKALGIVKGIYVPAENGRKSYIHRYLSLGDLPKLLDNPTLIFENAYGWGTSDFDYRTILSYIQRLVRSFRLIPYYEVISGKDIGAIDATDLDDLLAKWALNIPVFFLGTELGESAFGFRFYGLPQQGTSMPGLALLPYLTGEVSEEVDIAENVKLKIESSLSAEGNLALTLRPDEGFQLYKGLQNPAAATTTNGRFAINIFNVNADNSPILLLGNSAGSRLEYNGFSIKAGASLEAGKEPDVAFELGFKKVLLAIKSEGQDGFINRIIGDGFNADFDFTVGWSASSGFYIAGSSGLEISLPTHIELGPVSVEGLTIGAKPKNGKIPIELGADIKTTLGPVTAIVQNIGISAIFSFPANSSGNLGPVQLDLGFKSPSGVGLVVDSGGIKGGGFLRFDPENGEYFGAMELEFKDMFSMKAFGIINTKLPDGSSGYSLLIVITAEFTPIQLGFGFTLNGIGGLLGANRTVKVDILKEGIKTNAIKSILFPENVVANINRIVSDIKQIFPPMQGHFLILPMAKIGWGTPTIITLELGLLIEVPASRLIILGVLKALLPEEDKPLLKLQVNFIGEIDFENKSISFDAILYDSKLLTFTLSGQMALRIAFGDHPLFILSVGGFHPAFKEIPAGLEQMQRLTIGIVNTNDLKITIQTYFAVTSNTVQFGAKAELFASHGSWNLYGFIGYDVLFQFEPFKFMADFSAGVALRRNESVIMGIQVSGSLAGPSPWDASGKASVSFFFFSVSIPFRKTWGNTENDLTEKVDIAQMLRDIIADKRSWSAAIPANKNLHVSIKALSVPENILVIHPLGVLTFVERLVPLGISINKFGNKLPQDAHLFEIKTSEPDLQTEQVKEQFAPANFLNLSDSEKLARGSFEPFPAGFRIIGSEALQAPMLISKSVTYEFTYLGRTRPVVRPKYSFDRKTFKRNAGGGVIVQSALSHTRKRSPASAPAHVAFDEELFVIAQVSNMQLYVQAPPAGNYSETIQYYEQLVGGNPALQGQLQVLSQFELNPN